jgi:hypothetical protein
MFHLDLLFLVLVSLSQIIWNARKREQKENNESPYRFGGLQ